jgi:hypothetical protein
MAAKRFDTEGYFPESPPNISQNPCQSSFQPLNLLMLQPVQRVLGLARPYETL